MREYPKEYAKDFLEKSKRFLEIAETMMEKFPDESCFNTIQAVINANDAFTIYELQKRASIDHREALLLHKDASMRAGESKADVVQAALELRDAAGYDVKKKIGKEDVRILLIRAKRFVSWVELILGR